MVDRIEEELEKDLSRIIGFVNSCDSKSSIVMSGVLAIVALIAGLNGPSLADHFKNNLDSAGVILSLVFLIVSVALIIIGLSFVISSLYARGKPDNQAYHDSLIYYGSISSLEYDDYKESVLSRTNEDYLEDLASQVHINSVICSKKYRLYNKGLIFSIVGIILLFACLLSTII